MSDPGDPSEHPARPRLADPRSCPWCGQDPAGPVCRACGLRLTGDLAARLWHAGTQADHWLDARHALLLELRRASVTAPATPAVSAAAASAPAAQVAPPVPQGPPAAGSAVPPPRPPLAPQAPVAAWTPGSPGGQRPAAPAAVPTWATSPSAAVPAASGPHRGIGVQAVLVGVGALLVAVAAVVFLAFSWDLLGLVGRSLVVGGLTAAVLGGAALARRVRLGATAEAVASLGVVLVLLDAAAVRATGLAGEGMGVLSYSAAAAFTCAVLLGGYGLLTRLRAATVASSVVLPLAPVLAGAHVAATGGDLSTGSTAVALGLAGASGLALVRRPVARLRPSLVAERAVLRTAALGAWSAAAATNLLVLTDGLLAGAGVAAVLAVLAVAQALVEDRTPVLRSVWAVAAGVVTAWAVSLLVLHLLPGRWTPLTLPLAVGVLACALALLGRLRRADDMADGTAPGTGLAAALARPAAVGAAGALAVAALPAAVVGLLQLFQAPALAHPAWSAGLTQTVLSAAGTDVVADATARWCAAAGLVVAASAAVALTTAFGRRLTGPVAVLATLTAGVAVLGLPWQPGAPVVVALVAAVVLAVGLAVAAVLLERAAPSAAADRHTAAVGGSLIALAATSLVTAVLASWANQWASVPVTVLAAAALVAARRRHPALGPVLLPGAALALLVCVGAVGRWAGMSAGDAALTGAAAGSLAVLCAVLLPSLDRVERRALLTAGAVPTLTVAVTVSLLDAVSASGANTWSPRPQLLLLAASAAALVAALRPLQRIEPVDARVSAGAATALLAGLAASVAAQWGPVPVPLGVAATVAVAALVAAAAGRAADGRRAPVEAVGTAVTTVVLLFLVADGSAARAWGPVLVLAGAAAVLATVPDRRWSAWVGLALASAGLWLRLADAGVGTVEAYSLPPAVVLLAVAAVTWRRVGNAITPTAVGGAGLALVPTAVVGVTGPAWRAAAVLAVCAALLAAAASLVRRGTSTGAQRWWSLALLLTAAAVVALAVGPWLRSLRLAGGPMEGPFDAAEWWSLPVAGLLAVTAVLARRLLSSQRPAPVAAPSSATAPSATAPAAAAPAGSAALEWAAVPALVALTLPGLLALWTDHVPSPQPLALQPARVLLVVLAGGALAVACAAVRRPPLGAPAQAAGVVAATLAVLTGFAAGVATSGRPAELLSVPLALVVLVTGWVEMRRRPTLGSWPWIGSGCALLLLPSLLATLAEPHVVRVAWLAAAGAGVLVAGAVARWQAPVVVASLVLVAHGAVQLGPWIAVVYATAPRWVSLGLAGAVLLAIGARYEQRLRDVKVARLRLESMR